MKIRKSNIEMIKSIVIVSIGMTVSFTPKVNNYMLQYLKPGWQFMWILVALFLAMRVGIFADDWDKEDRK